MSEGHRVGVEVGSSRYHCMAVDSGAEHAAVEDRAGDRRVAIKRGAREGTEEVIRDQVVADRFQVLAGEGDVRTIVGEGVEAVREPVVFADRESAYVDKDRSSVGRAADRSVARAEAQGGEQENSVDPSGALALSALRGGDVLTLEELLEQVGLPLCQVR